MNRFHRHLCRSRRWARFAADTLVPTVDDLDLGDDVLEIGPGYGVTTQALAQRVPRLTALEIDPELADRLRRRYPATADAPATVAVVTGDATALPFPDGRFSAAVCFTMLHHVPSAQQQDRVFAEVARVLRPGGVFAGSDSVTSARFRLIHAFDVCVPVDPATLPQRLGAAGFAEVSVTASPRLTFRAVRPPRPR